MLSAHQQIERKASVTDRAEPLDDLRPDEPRGIRFVLSLMPNTDQRQVGELHQPLRDPWLQQVHPTHDSQDQIRVLRNIEEPVGLLVRGGSLHDHRALHGEFGDRRREIR